MRSVDVVDRFDRNFFEAEIVPAYRPVVFKGAVSHWPIVKKSLESTGALVQFLNQRATPGKIWTIEAPREISGGRFFYSEQGEGFNFSRKIMTFEDFSDRLLKWVDDLGAPALSIQSAHLDEYFHELRETHPMPLCAGDVQPRIWIGNRSEVAAHYDHSDNLACVAAGKRRFTLFPPDQIGNLYLGPIDKTIGGAPVSMVSLASPDFHVYPKFKQALNQALVADLDPGDVIYIPSLWFHNVEALDGINALINFWLRDGRKVGARPADAMLMALLTMFELPAPEKEAWKSFFDYYVFNTSGDPGAHLPVSLKGILGGIDKSAEDKLKRWLVRQLSTESK